MDFELPLGDVLRKALLHRREAFNLDRGHPLKEKWDLIPDQLDLLITHGPPFGILDPGIDVGPDGRAFVCTTISGGVTVLSPEGEVLEEISLDEHATNCIFDGPVLYVTATKVAEIHADQRTGSFWRVETDATGPLPLLPGRL